MKLGTTEIILIIVLALVLFGGSKIAGLGGALGKSIKDFKSAVKEDDAKESDKDEKKEKDA
ncbi:MAG: twin-arginine translocase TatA/TatE family subunit [Clostridia bacterium]|nr:twin-arginine translocase TatA/TatE family subunit [Clostridia bacterium]